ncbi:MAG: hypothetical protein R3F11_26070 [Verrucomicrobiales bacterium]
MPSRKNRTSSSLPSKGIRRERFCRGGCIVDASIDCHRWVDVDDLTVHEEFSRVPGYGDRDVRPCLSWQARLNLSAAARPRIARPKRFSAALAYGSQEDEAVGFHAQIKIRAATDRPRSSRPNPQTRPIRRTANAGRQLHPIVFAVEPEAWPCFPAVNLGAPTSIAAWAPVVASRACPSNENAAELPIPVSGISRR